MSHGLIGYTLEANLVRRTLSTLSVWRDRYSLTSFVDSAHHQSVAANTRHLLERGDFARWTTLGAELPPNWTVVNERLNGL